MRFAEALKLARDVGSREQPTFNVSLVSASTPLSLITFTQAFLGRNDYQRSFKVSAAPYGDLVESVRRALTSDADAIAIVIEYYALDPRLGLRRVSSWTDSALADVLIGVEQKLASILHLLTNTKHKRTVLHPPALPLPPITGQGSWQLSKFHASLAEIIARFNNAACDVPGIIIASPSINLAKEPRNADGETAADFPYTQESAAFIGETIAHCIRPPAPLKGIITDLDDTFWRGLVGEVGPEGVHWNLDGKSQMHAVYQQLLAALASRGILVAVASKNDNAVVTAALERDDLLISRDSIFPVIANWDPKSKAVEQILARWNVGADSVVFVDDNRYELEEVSRSFPTMETRHFPTTDANAVYNLLNELRDLCHKEKTNEEDVLRLQSIRASAEIAVLAQETSLDDFLSGIGASIKLEKANASDTRALELVNKTNQFNLNGRRWSDSEWSRYLEDDSREVVSISYSDKFGALGKIGVIMCRRDKDELEIEQWVLSCRAFARRIEHATLKSICGVWRPRAIRFDYQKTEKNSPIAEFLATLSLADNKVSEPELLQSLPEIYASIEERINN
ncbi:HAD-IIIC family phosphatase [Agrobacterium tumefaciens]|uniref:HAD-IIIC family phosphatase n=1 Tax=Agrobacterium tumefaciens TaxID=358 RepID=UPI00157360A3|nr:HAD-IIIC family phosphatase [Agrobacterium tumefaciens]WCK73119.1 HAD-IIIC family phosphatase [Agrobacterium tumefaciens]